MAQVAILYSPVDLDAIDAALREAHAHFLLENRDALVTFGPIRNTDGSPAGYAYQTDFPGTTIEVMYGFLASDPLAKAGLFHAGIMKGWKCALKHRQMSMPQRPAMQGFFFHGVGKPNVTVRRNEIIDAHRSHLRAVDESNCIARGHITDATGQEWLGSAMVYEFPDRRALDAFFADEPYHVNGIYERTDVYHWRRGEMAA